MAKLIVNGNGYKVDSLYQWDINQVLQIYGLSIPDPEIHFANEAMSCTIPGYPTVDDKGVISVAIPNSLLQKHYSITVYVCGYEGETFKTYCKVRIPINERSKPGDYTLEVTDEEVYSFNELTRRINACEESLGNNVAALDNKINSNVESINNKLATLTDNLSATNGTAEDALAIAKGKNQARVFATTEAMYAWLADSANKGTMSVGDNLYIVAVDVPDWWISEVLTEPNADGHYYNVAKLETQKVDLTDIIEAIEAINEDVESINNSISEMNTNINNVELSSVKIYKFSIPTNKIYKLYNTEENNLFFKGILGVVPIGPAGANYEILTGIYGTYPGTMPLTKDFSSISTGSSYKGPVYITAKGISLNVMVLSDCDTLACEYDSDYTS